ncbi:hypothetical protein GC093_08590 [Paenibacillus sp. LMG 31456]|uniref:Uncharacterized protein n=1 Tax=Paenibacillus foliorum TaxID=2654974 RepID=A0A972GM56_9BACL|nr:hypothetical protein [Paenibacillus foliorum]NOU93274.1 hypothetical protein [Paenibacillus foliorum]
MGEPSDTPAPPNRSRGQLEASFAYGSMLALRCCGVGSATTLSEIFANIKTIILLAFLVAGLMFEEKAIIYFSLHDEYGGLLAEFITWLTGFLLFIGLIQSLIKVDINRNKNQQIIYKPLTKYFLTEFIPIGTIYLIVLLIYQIGLAITEEYKNF